MVYYHLGLAYESLGEYALAEENLQKAFKLFPKTGWKNDAKAPSKLAELRSVSTLKKSFLLERTLALLYVGSRQKAFEDFRNSLGDPKYKRILLLVDAESEVATGKTAWKHLHLPVGYTRACENKPSQTLSHRAHR